MGAYEKALLKKKYGWSGQKYRDLMGKVISENYKKISSSVLSADSRRYKKDMTAILGISKEKIIIPDVSNIIRRSPTIRKSADRGKLLEASMREEMRKIVKRGLLASNITTTGGTVRKNVAKNVEKELNIFFKGYTKKDPKFGMPPNVHAIAVTETRSVISQVRKEYTGRVLADNPDIEIEKTWVHNDSLSEQWRIGHKKIHGQKKKFKEKFIIPVYKKVNGKWRFMGRALADHPHDASLSAEEVIQCNCEAVYRIVKKRK